MTRAVRVTRGTTGSRIDREPFLRAAGIRPLATAELLASEGAFVPERWNHEADVVIVGSGTAMAAAATAADAGASVIVLEKAAIYGGTTRHSGGSVWIPNNTPMRRLGRSDTRTDAIRYMARCAYPTLYDSALPNLGLPQLEYDLIATFYDRGSEAMDYLTTTGALDITSFLASASSPQVLDYYPEFPENKAPEGRALKPTTVEGTAGNGNELIRQLKRFTDARGVQYFLRHRVLDVLFNAKREVVGVVAENADGEAVTVRAHKGVIFGTGGFPHDADKRRNFLRAPVVGGCGMATNQGDFIDIAQRAGAELGMMAWAKWSQLVFEHASDTSNGNVDGFLIAGDSCILVNKYGKRVVSETRDYHDRSTVHHVWHNTEYPNHLLFMIYDQRVADGPFSGVYPLPTAGVIAPYVIKANSYEELAARLDRRLEYLHNNPPHEVRTGGVRLAQDFLPSLQETISNFAKYAEDGYDPEFNRGGTPAEAEMLTFAPDNDKPNKKMYPLSPTGPYYAIILVGCCYETSAGPKSNGSGQILRPSGRPIEGLYGVGNCVASVFGQSYPGGGASLGPGLTFAYVAAKHAVASSIKEA